MIGWTLCSGIGAPEMAATWVDWRLASEIEKFPRAVLQHRFGYRLPDDHNQGDPLLWGDMSEVTPELARARGVPLPDVLVAGTPCQAFSIAGLRKGTADARGNLTLKFVETCHAIVDARPDRKLAVLWENVFGVLSDNNNAFGCFLGGLVGSMDALPSPDGGSWPSEGMVQGPRSRAAWCVLDAQWFGVAQRRRRVFVVVDFGNCVDPAAVLLEPDRLRGDTPPRRETGQGTARGFETGPHGGSITEVTPTLDTSCKDGPVRSQIGAGVISALMTAIGEYSDDDTASSLKARDYKDATDLVAHTLSAEGFDASEDGTGRGTPLVPVAFDCKGTEVQNDVSGVSPPLRSMGHNTSHQNAGGHAAVAFDLNQVTSPTNRSRPDPSVYHTIPAASCAPHLAQPWAVRRLTPTECARLQGFPDNHAQIPWRGKPAESCPDGPQYKAYGNSMAVPVVAWIMDRIRISMGMMP